MHHKKIPLDHIALGGTYQLQAAAVGNPLVVVEAITVHHTCTPGYSTPAAVLQTALVWVYEAARETRYPTDPRHLRIP